MLVKSYRDYATHQLPDFHSLPPKPTQGSRLPATTDSNPSFRISWHRGIKRAQNPKESSKVALWTEDVVLSKSWKIPGIRSKVMGTKISGLLEMSTDLFTAQFWWRLMFRRKYCIICVSKNILSHDLGYWGERKSVRRARGQSAVRIPGWIYSIWLTGLKISSTTSATTPRCLSNCSHNITRSYSISVCRPFFIRLFFEMCSHRMTYYQFGLLPGQQ